ncbi:unnamed protein product, partial [Sphacelaria rigidula]
MNSILITNPQGEILLSRYFDSSFRLTQDATVHTSIGHEGGGQTDTHTMRDRAMAMRVSESEVLGQTRHLWTTGTPECPQVARVK